MSNQPQTNDEEPAVVDRRASARMGGDEQQPASERPAPPTGGSSAELDAEREKAEQYYKNWQRSAADFINYKRRVESERSEQARFAGAALVINLLPIFDDMDRAVSNIDAGLAGLNWVQGVVNIHRKFANLLEAMDVHPIEADGQAFDPAFHEAVARQPGEEGKVIGVIQKGYTLADRVIRPAMVVVGDGQPIPAGE